MVSRIALNKREPPEALKCLIQAFPVSFMGVIQLICASIHQSYLKNEKRNG